VRTVNIKALRQRLGLLTQTEFARRFQLAPGTLFQWETGRHRPDATARVLLAVINYAPDVVEAAIAAAGLERKKLRGAKFAAGGRAGAITNKAQADRFAGGMLPIIRQKASGITTSRGIARSLTARGVPTARGGRWTHVRVRGLLDRTLTAVDDGEGAEAT
jgi:DNA-binding XRE family transcriptional regulator